MTTTNYQTSGSGSVPLLDSVTLNNIFFAILMIAALLPGYSQTVSAHDPGTSITTIDISGDGIILQSSYSLRDIETLKMIDADGDEVYSLSELNIARPDLAQVFSKGIELRNDSRLLTADYVEFTIESNENLIFTAEFREIEKSELNLYMPVLEQLPRGHRQYLLVGTNTGSYENVLSAQSNPLILDLDPATSTGTFVAYLTQGMHHIFIGFDHILFLLTLLLPAVLFYHNNKYEGTKRLMPALIDTTKIVTAFTLAHSVTLGLAVYQIVQLPGRLVESVIAFSIIICAVNNLKPIIPVSRWLLAFGFGLIHGFGFANALLDLGVASDKSIVPLLAFNVGIETGQLLIVMVVLPVIYTIRHSRIFRLWIFKGASIASILIASGWMLERSFLTQL